MRPGKSMRRALSQGLFVAMVGAAVACGTARMIQRSQLGGTIELEGDHNKAMEQANEEMAAHCGLNNFTILDEGEEARGGGEAQGGRAATAWRVHYQCGTGGAPIANEPGKLPPAPPPSPH